MNMTMPSINVSPDNIFLTAKSIVISGENKDLDNLPYRQMASFSNKT
jgi:hypothetical protein